MENNKRVLVIDDEDFIRELVKDFLELENILCDDAEDEVVALDLVKKNDYDLILLDRNLAKTQAEEVIVTLRDLKPDLIIVLLTGDPDYDEASARLIGADGVIFKPFQVDEFLTHIAKYLEN